MEESAPQGTADGSTEAKPPTWRQQTIHDAHVGGRYALAAAAVAVAISSFRQGAGFHLGIADFATTTVFVVGLALHCAFDAHAHRHTFPLSMMWLFCGFWFVSVPGYWIYHRGPKGLAWVMAVAAGLLGIAALSGWAGFSMRLSFALKTLVP